MRTKRGHIERFDQVIEYASITGGGGVNFANPVIGSILWWLGAVPSRSMFAAWLLLLRVV